MKRLYIFLAFTLLLTACVRPARSSPTITPAGTDILEEFLQTAKATTNATQAPSLQATQTGKAAGGGETPQPSQADVNPLPTVEANTPTPPPPTATNTPPGPTATNTPEDTATPLPSPDTPPMNPDFLFSGSPRFVESFDDPIAWGTYSGALPDTENLKLVIQNGEMRVTGKFDEWDTWWFGGTTQGDIYIEMDVYSGNCSGTDAYGLIVRGAPANVEEPTHGYIVAFTCEGKVYARRLDSANPYIATQLLVHTASGALTPGPNQTNTLGIHFEEDAMTIYVNRHFFTTIYDETYRFGRWGIYVKAGEDGNYTYMTPEIRLWVLEE